MTHRLTALLAAIALLLTGCRSDDRPPTAPSAASQSTPRSGPIPGVRGVMTSGSTQQAARAGASSFAFPPRNEPFDFRNQLEAKYRDGLKRGAIQTSVDVEGDIVWMQEYLRYRVNECDHLASTQKVFQQIDGGGPSEQNQPNTIFASCADGLPGQAVSEGIRVATVDGGPLAAGKTVQIVVRWRGFGSATRLFVSHTREAQQSVWTPLQSFLARGTTVDSVVSFVLPAGGLQAVRAGVKFGGGFTNCGGNGDDSDDLVFRVQ